MKFAVILTTAFLAMAGAASAQATCARPTAPGTVDGATATMEQVLALKNDVASFIAASDVFQDCLIKGVEAQRATAKESKAKFDEAVAKSANAQIEANQKDKENAGKAFNAAVKAYRTAHPS